MAKKLSENARLARNAKARSRYALDPKKGAAPSKKWRAKNPERAKASSKAWHEAHPERVVELGKAWRKKNAKRVKATHDAWVAAHPKRVSEISMKWTRANKERTLTNSRAWQAANKDKVKADHKEWRDNKFKALTGRKRPKVCDVCKRRGRRIHYDHCHKTGLFRGWLCHGCNLALGGVADSAKILRQLADYLDAYKAKPKVKGVQAKAQKLYASQKAAYYATLVAKTKEKKK